jgi:hypothetical protein
MVKTKRFILTVSYILAAMALNSAPKVTNQEINLRSGNSKLNFSSNGLHISTADMEPASADKEQISWSLTLQKQGDFENEVVITSAGNSPVISSLPKGYKISYMELRAAGKIWDIALDLYISAGEKGFSVKTVVTNNIKDWVVVNLYGPVADGIKSDLYNYPLILPCGLGQIFTKEPSEKEPMDKVSFKGGLSWDYDKSSKSYSIESAYPSRFTTMQWYAIAGERSGIYFGSHDKTHASKHIRVNYIPSTGGLRFGFEYDFTCFYGESKEIPEMVISPYTGTWHNAADIYREWFDTSIKLQEVPEWAKNSSGWMLTILKQQNEEIMWNYDSLEELCRLSEERGLDMIGLFGWTIGGHDRFYPDYIPDPAMGGKKALENVIGKIHKRGKHAIIYANGQLIDQNGTDYWPQTGKNITVVKRDGSLDYQKWHKYYDAPARFHGMACLGCNEWYERMLSLAIQANELGADGILYDQLAVTAPKLCYSPDHGHPVPAVVYETDRYTLLERIATYMKTINKDFIIMTEGLCDAVLGSVSYFHGYENGAYVPLRQELDARLNKSAFSSVFPEMFKYTFPEVLTTYRNPAPVNNRLILNYATVFGLRSELESRYSADVRYLKENRKPVPGDYSNVISKPDIDLVTSEDPEAMKLYSKEVIDFQRSFAWILWHGKYLDTKGFSITCSNTVIARAYEAGNRLCVVVWNTGLNTEDIKLDVPGYVFEYSAGPEENVKYERNKIQGESIRLFMWKK